MTEKEKAHAGLLYEANSDEELVSNWKSTKRKCFEYNNIPPWNEEERMISIKNILHQTGDNITILSPFYCDYGYNIEIEEDFFANMNLVILDGAKVKIGKNVYIGPNVGIYTAGHPLNQQERIRGLEYAYPVTIGNNVWIGAHAVILPGISIGDNTVIGAGSIVTKNIPQGVLAVGNPCKVIRKIIEEDFKKD